MLSFTFNGLMKIFWGCCFGCLILIMGCEKENNSRVDRFGFGTISEEQRDLQAIFKSIILDEDTLGLNQESIDYFILDTIRCNINETFESCDSAAISGDFWINVGDTLILKNEQLTFQHASISLAFGLINSPDDFPFMEFGEMENGTMVNCCIYSTINFIDIVTTKIDFSFNNYKLSIVSQ